VDDDPGANPQLAASHLHAEMPLVNLRKTVGKGLEGIRGLLSGGLYSGGAYFFAVLCVAGVLYRFRNPDAARVHRAHLAGLAVAVLVLPFLSSGAAAAHLAGWLAPLLVVFGAGFLYVLIETTGERPPWQIKGLLALALALHALPLTYDLAAPRRLPFTYPPYVPSLFALTRQHIMSARPETQALMCDVPAGFAWYADCPAWQQPARYEDFDRIHRLQYIAAQLISPQTLGRPYFSELSRGETQGWNGVYIGLAARQMPYYHPLRRIVQLQPGTFVLTE